MDTVDKQLDYNTLREKLGEHLSKESKESLEVWIKMDKERMGLQAENDRLKELLTESEGVKDKTTLILKSQTISMLQAEVDRLRLALSDKTEELNEVKSSRAVTGERCIELDDENHRLRESLSGKTQYDQVEVERERLRKIVEAMITGYRPFPDNDRGVEERNAIRRDVCEWFLELLSHPQ